jgi:hypothetical protein
MDDVKLQEIRMRLMDLEKEAERVHDRIPAGWEMILGPFEIVVVDKGCNEPIGWGHRVLVDKLDEATLGTMKATGDLEYLVETDGYAFVTSWLTEEKAIARYGERGETKWGPRGAYKGVFYGKKEFAHKQMKPKDAKPPEKEKAK